MTKLDLEFIVGNIWFAASAVAPAFPVTIICFVIGLFFLFEYKKTLDAQNKAFEAEWRARCKETFKKEDCG